MPNCKFKNSCLQCMDCETTEPENMDCRAFINYSAELLKQEAGTLFSEKINGLFDEPEGEV